MNLFINRTLSFYSSAFVFCGITFSQQSSPPNIILIMADDLGWGDVGFNGNRNIKTPCLDSLASQGTVLTHFYAGAPLSSPTRASVLTGRNAFRTGVFSANEGILRPEEKTLPEYLKTIGYTTGHFGKWHMGTLTYTEIDANRGRPENVNLFNPPSEHGYDESFVTESKVPTCDPMFAPIRNNGRFWDRIGHEQPKKLYGTSYWDTNNEKVVDNLDGDDSRIIMDRVLPFISKAVSKESPFLATIWFHTPHLPCVAEPKYASMYEGYSMEQRNYFGCITAMDAQISRLIVFLKRNDLYDNTIILFCSDNGPEINTPGSAGVLRGMKRSLYEGGIRVPSFIVWGKRNKDFTQTMSQPSSTDDYLPTLADLCGFSLSDERKIDGESLLPFLTGQTTKRKKPLVFCSGSQGAVVLGHFKLYVSKNKTELYNLDVDPNEQHDISATYPKIVFYLKSYLYKQIADFQDSFEGKEYGTSSLLRLNQQWHSIFNK